MPLSTLKANENMTFIIKHTVTAVSLTERPGGPGGPVGPGGPDEPCTDADVSLVT